MRIKISLFTLVLVGITLVSFSFKKKPASPGLAGFWVVDSPNSQAYQVKVFEKSGAFYNLYFNNGESVITHKGTYKMIDKDHYREKVTDLRSNAAYNLLNKEFINTYELSSDESRLVLSGVVVSKNGVDTLRWRETYKRISIP
jgi:hypothetical protein